MSRSRVTLAMIDAAATLAQRASPFDRQVVDDADADRDGALADDREERLALLGGEELRVGEAADAAVCADDDGGRDDRPGEGPPPRLVDAGHPGDACLPGSSLVVVRRRRGRRHVAPIYSCSVAPEAGTRGMRFSLRRAALPASPRR
jgi:hypothetical protein